MQKFRMDNTEGYTAADLAHLNDLYTAMCKANGVDPVDGEKSHLDHIAETVQATYDATHAAGRG